MTYPTTAGYQANEASKEAASLLNPDLNFLQRKVYQDILNCVFGTTPEEISERIGTDLYLVRPRITELRHLGLIEEAGRKKIKGKRVPITMWQAITRKP